MWKRDKLKVQELILEGRTFPLSTWTKFLESRGWGWEREPRIWNSTRGQHQHSQSHLGPFIKSCFSKHEALSCWLWYWVDPETLSNVKAVQVVSQMVCSVILNCAVWTVPDHWGGLTALLSSCQVAASGEGSAISGYLSRCKRGKRHWKKLWFVIKGKVLYTYMASEVLVICTLSPLLWNDPWGLHTCKAVWVLAAEPVLVAVKSLVSNAMCSMLLWLHNHSPLQNLRNLQFLCGNKKVQTC